MEHTWQHELPFLAGKRLRYAGYALWLTCSSQRQMLQLPLGTEGEDTCGSSQTLIRWDWATGMELA